MKFGRYHVVKEVGKGAMGVVYRAHDPDIDRIVALKVLRPDRVTSQDFVSRFLKEAKAIGRLSHPNIVTVYDVGSDNNNIYIAMEFLEGKPLNEILRERALSLEEIIRVGSQIADSLRYAHEKGIVHRDIKPPNIILNDEGQVKITDFGIAHIEDPSSTQQTKAGEILGTPMYMAPEQIVGGSVDGRSDLYALGVILYEMTTRKRPFKGDNLASIFHSITQEMPERPEMLNPEIPKPLSDLIMKCIQKRPEERFSTGAQVAEALRNCTRRSDFQKTGHSAGFRAPRSLLWVASVLMVSMAAAAFFLIISPVKPPEKPPESQEVHSSTRQGHTGGPQEPGDIKSPGSQTKPVEKPDDLSSVNRGTDLPGSGPAATDAEVLGSLSVDTEPSGASLFIDGSFRGNTPISLDLPPGKHEVRLSLDTFYEWEAQVKLEGNELTPIFVKLTPLAF